MSNPIDPMRVLRERMAEALSPLGLELRQFINVVADEESGDVIQAVFTIDRDAIGKTQEQIHFDAAFDDLARNFTIQKTDDAEAETRANLQRLLDRNKPYPPQEGT